ncbi:unnamed protein product, partial [Prorocentrum cordatum]
MTRGFRKGQTPSGRPSTGGRKEGGREAGVDVLFSTSGSRLAVVAVVGRARPRPLPIALAAGAGGLNSQLYSNRAAVSLRVGEYQKAVDDCRRAILQDPANIKARFRGAKASEALGLTSQAIRFCDGALALSPAEKEVLQL